MQPEVVGFLSDRTASLGIAQDVGRVDGRVFGAADLTCAVVQSQDKLDAGRVLRSIRRSCRIFCGIDHE